MKVPLLQSVLLLALVFLFSCKKDPSQPSNHMAYGSKNATLGDAICGTVLLTPYEDVYMTYLSLFENTFEIKYVGGEPDSLIGSGDVIFLELLTNSYLELPSGKYSFTNSSVGPYVAFHVLPESLMIINFDSVEETGQEAMITGGTLEVNKSGDEYELKFNFTTDINSDIEGYYKGKMFFGYYEKKSQSPSVWLSSMMAYRIKHAS